MGELLNDLNKLVEEHGMVEVIFALQCVMIGLPRFRRSGLHHTLDAAFKQAREIADLSVEEQPHAAPKR